MNSEFSDKSSYHTKNRQQIMRLGYKGVEYESKWAKAQNIKASIAPIFRSGQLNNSMLPGFSPKLTVLDCTH
jgi:hypothetical protein